MGIVQAIVYGIIQGLTEFLPVSSDAHLRVIPALLGWGDPGAAFTAIIHLGTVAAVIIYFAKDVGKAFMAWFYSLTGRKDVDQTEARLGWAVFIGTLPIAILGFLLKHKVETTFRSLNYIGYALIGMGIVMLIAERVGSKKRKVKDVTVKDGLIVGLWQCAPLVPGMSRSGSTMAGAFFLGFDRVAAARFSFLLGIPAVTMAALYELYGALKESKAEALATGVPQIHWAPTIVAAIVAFIVGYAAIAFFLGYLQKRGLAPFVYYRLALGALILFLVHQGKLEEYAGADAPAKTAYGGIRGGTGVKIRDRLELKTSRLACHPGSEPANWKDLPPRVKVLGSADKLGVEG